MIEKSQKSEINPASTSATAGVSAEAPRVAKTFEVVIAGVPLRLKSSHDEETVNHLVALVDQRIREALPLTKTGSIQNAAILASLHLAEEFVMIKRKAQTELEGLESKALKVISELESSRSTPKGMDC
jgi:cell division protein ZapA